ncbi:Serine/threonine-protein phosphatase 6 regulatory subunit 3 [Schistosoma japonicum]|nr:Serine/threonine-protein phosphatase 6 regulatory subunit 3 [Schistosoma japonicum]
MSLIFNRILCNEYVLPSILVSCVNVFLAVMGEKKHESCFAVGEDGQTLNFQALLKSFTHKNNIEMYSGDANMNFNTSFHNSNVNKALNNQNGNNCISSTNSRIDDNVVRLNRSSESSRDNTTSVDKLHIMKASENLIKACLPRLPQLHDLLQRFHPQFYNTIPTTNGVLAPPLGRCRLAILQLIAALLSIPISTELPKAIVDSGFLKTSMKLFSCYSYNTFLHHYVTDIIKSLFKHLGFIDNSVCNTGNNTSSMSGKMNSNVETPTSVASNQPITVDTSFDHGNQLTESLSPSKTSLSSSSSSPSSPDSSSSTTTSIETNSDVICSTDQCNPVSTTDVNEHDKRTQIISEINDSHSSSQNTANESNRSVVDNLMKDHRIVEWCLALSPLPSRKKRSKEAKSGNSVVRLCKLDRKPGYSGHIWLIGNIIVAAMNGPQGEFMKSTMEGIRPKLQNMWSDFIKDLNVINAVQVTEASQSSTDGFNNSEVPFILAPVTSSNLMQNKLSDVNEKWFSDLLDDDVDNDNTTDIHRDENKFREQYGSIYSVYSIQEQVTLQNVLNLWLDSEKESESSDDNNSNDASGKQDDFTSFGPFVVVPGPLRPWHTLSSDEFCYDDDDDYFLNSDDNSEGEGDGSEDSENCVSDRSYVNGNNNDDEEDDDEEDLKSPIQIKQQHSYKQFTTKTNTVSSTLCSDSAVLFKVKLVIHNTSFWKKYIILHITYWCCTKTCKTVRLCHKTRNGILNYLLFTNCQESCESIPNLESTSMMSNNNSTSNSISRTLSTDMITLNEHKDSSDVSTSNTKNNLISSEEQEPNNTVESSQPFQPVIISNILKKQ